MVRSILMPTKPPPWGRKTTHTKSELKSNAATGNSSHKQDTRQLVTCEFQSSTSKPDKEVHFRYSRRNSESDHRHKFSKGTWHHKPQYKIRGKADGTATSQEDATRRHYILPKSSSPSAGVGPGDVDWRSPHTPKAN